MANSNGIFYSSVKSPQHPNLYSKSPQHPNLYSRSEGVELCRQRTRAFSVLRSKFCSKALWRGHRKPLNPSFLCRSTETHNTETKESMRTYGDYSDVSSSQECDERIARSQKNTPSGPGLAEACKFAYNDAKFMNERARSDIVLLSRGIMRLDARARQDVAILGSGFLKLDARAREDTEKIDLDVKRRAERLHQIAIILRDKAQSRLKRVADQHWSDGALEADLRRADFVAKQRAMEDSLMALEFVKNIHDRMVNKMYKLKRGSPNANEIAEHITLEKNGKTLEFLPGEMSADRITAVQEAYWDIATALSEADGFDYTDPEELELLIAALIDLDAMDSKSSVSLLAECSSSPDVNTRKALANALSAAPCMWRLGNAGMGALQRLAEDSNPVIAGAASKTITELKRQWEIEEGDSWRFMVNQIPSDVNSQKDD